MSWMEYAVLVNLVLTAGLYYRTRRVKIVFNKQNAAHNWKTRKKL